MTHALLAILAPGSVEAEVGRVQQRIFAEHGLVSSVAFPPLVPVAFLAGPAPRRGLAAELNRSVVSPYRITLTGLAWREGWLYLALDTGGVWAALRAAALAALASGEAGPAAQEGPGLFPVFEGFLLGCKEAQAAQRELIRPPLPSVGFTSSTLAVMRIEAAEGAAWWRGVSTEVLDETPLRGRRGR